MTTVGVEQGQIMTGHIPYSSLVSYEATPTKHHRSYPLHYKLSVVQWMEEQGCSLRAAAKQFGLDRKVIRSWLKNRDTLKSALSLYGPEKRKLHHGRPPKSQELDKQVLDYLLNSQSEGVSVCDQQLQRKAREYAISLGLKDFKAASTWLKRWKTRCGVDGKNEIKTNSNCFHDKVNEACCLSHVMSGDPVKLLAHWTSSVIAPNGSCDEMQGPVHYDTSTSEHNYCKGSSLLLDQTSLDLTASTTDVTYRMLQCSNVQDEQPFPMTSSSGHPAAVLTVFEVVPPANDDITMIFGDECIMGSLDLPLSHEEIVRDEDNDGQITVDQTTTLQTDSIQCDLISSDSKPLTQPKTRTARRRRGKGRGRSCRQATTRKSDKKSFDDSLVPATLPHLMLDDPQGPSGLLASRILQPVFPDEPEIVYMDMQLGTLTH